MAKKKVTKRKPKAAKPFSEVEDFYVKSHTGQKTAAEIASVLGRSEAEVAARVIELAPGQVVESKRRQLETLQPKPGVTTITSGHSKLADDIEKQTKSEGGQAFMDQFKNCIAPAFPK